MRYISVCSGLEAATVAWHPLGWRAAWFSEIEPFTSAILAHHYPTVPNLGDMTKFEEWPDESIDLLVGGTPCQSFSVAGLQAGLADPRGGLMLKYIEIARRYRPRWIVWENVPGVLSSNGGRDFGSFLGALGQLGYGWAYRVLDAQWFGVSQRRRRVFVVGCLGDSKRAAKVLFERESVCRDTPSSRETGQDAARSTSNGTTQPKHYRKSRRAQSIEDYETWVEDSVSNTLNCFDIGDIRSTDLILDSNGQVRRLTPVEWERLQGFPDGYTDIPWKPNAPDGSRYRALGNSMAVPVMRWIGQRISQNEAFG